MARRSRKCRKNPWQKGKSRKRSDAMKKAWRKRKRAAAKKGKRKGKKMRRSRRSR